MDIPLQNLPRRNPDITESSTDSLSKDPASDESVQNADARKADMERQTENQNYEANEIQAGVRNMEAVSITWTKWGLIMAYLGIFLVAFSTSLEGQVVASLAIFATSSFNNHSLISTVYVVQGVVNAVIKPPMAKIADVFGRLEAFSLCVLLFVIGYIQQATSTNVQTYAAAQIFYSMGATGLQTLQQIFIADTSDLVNRALWSSLPDIPFLITVWVGAPIGQRILKTTTWRWGYGIWCIILPAAFLPLALSLFFNNRKAKKLGLNAPSPWKGLGPLQIAKSIWLDLDLPGMILLSVAFALILIPLTIASKAARGWSSPDIIAMIVLGITCLIAFPVWESMKKLAPHPLIPLGLLRSRTFCAGCGIGFFYFMTYYLSVQPYFYSYLLVVQGLSVPAAGHVTQTFSFTATVSGILTSLLIKYTKQYKLFIFFGSLVYMMGIGLMIRFRQENSSIGSLIGTQIAVGIGGGMLNVPAQLAVQASVPSHQNVGVATAVYLTSVEIGGAVGSAISGAVWGHYIPRKLSVYLPDAAKADAKKIYDSINTALVYQMGSPERIAINRAYQETMHILLIIAICVSVPVVLLSLVVRNVKLDDDAVKGRVIGRRVERDDERDGDVLRGEGMMEEGERIPEGLPQAKVDLRGSSEEQAEDGNAGVRQRSSQLRDDLVQDTRNRNPQQEDAEQTYERNEIATKVILKNEGTQYQNPTQTHTKNTKVKNSDTEQKQQCAERENCKRAALELSRRKKFGKRKLPIDLFVTVPLPEYEAVLKEFEMLPPPALERSVSWMHSDMS